MIDMIKDEWAKSTPSGKALFFVGQVVGLAFVFAMCWMPFLWGAL